jgi:hypothetical protein
MGRAREAPMAMSNTAATTASGVRAWAPAATVCASSVVLAGALSTPVFPFDGYDYRSETTIYPFWVWVLVGACFLGGFGCLVARRSAARAAAAAIALTAALPLAGTGVVARRHWDPSFGHGGSYGTGYTSLGALQTMSAVMAAAAIVAGLAALAQLHVLGALPAHVGGWARPLSVCVGLAVVAALPLAVRDGGYVDADLTSWGILGLIYAGPWGVSIALSGWLRLPAAAASLLAVSGCAALAAIGPQLTWFAYPNPTGPFAAATAAPLVVLAARLAHGR